MNRNELAAAYRAAQALTEQLGTLLEGEQEKSESCRENSIESLDLSNRAYNALRRGFEGAGTPWEEVFQLSFRAILNLRPRQIRYLGVVSFSEVCEVLRGRGVSDEELYQSKWWSSAPSGFQLAWERRKSSQK